MKELFYIGGNQLFDPSYLKEHRGATVVMVEDEGLCRRMCFHQQKLGLLLSAMREHAAELTENGFDVRYFDLASQRSTEEAILDTAHQVNAQKLIHFDSEDRGLIRSVHAAAGLLQIQVVTLRSPMFLLDSAAVDEYFHDAKKPRFDRFYRRQRTRLRLLVEGNKPLGGRWSFDAQNRARLPRRQPIPELPQFKRSLCAQGCLELVTERFPGHPGKATDLWIPTDRTGASRWLDAFLEERLIGFGTYEDALSDRGPVLFHSVLSPFLNIGLVTPAQVVDRALVAAKELNVPLNDLEGFLRQVVGWREFVRGIYRRYGLTMQRRNIWMAERRLTDAWMDADTGLVPLDQALEGARERGWNHHIERLMVIANLMNLAEIHPADVYRFFMTHYIDAYDWVMVPNVFGMGLTSEGGIFASKPYICGSNYIRKMGHYPNGEWSVVMDGLYWRFVAKHRQVLATNPRLAMMVRALDRMDRKRFQHIHSRAEEFIFSNTADAR